MTTLSQRLRALAIDVRPLRASREFRLLFASQFVSFTGSMITFVAVPYQVYTLTHSSLAVGLLGLAELLPLVVLALVGGALADAFDRRRLMLLTEAALSGVSGLLALNALRPTPHLPTVYLLAGLSAGLAGLQRPARDALLPRLVARELLSAAAALSSLRGSIGMIGGPAVGGLLLAAFGLPATYLVDVLSFLVSLGLLLRMRPVPPPEGAAPPSLSGVLAGWRYARGRQELLGSYLVDMAAMFFGMPQALYPAMAEHFGGGRALGLLYAATAVGALGASLVSGWTARIHRHGLAIGAAATAWGVAILAFGVAHDLWLALAFLALAGGADAISGVFRSTLWNETIPDSLRGRLAAIEQLSYLSGPLLGNVESGLAASLFSVRVAVVSGGAACVVATLLITCALPGFLHYDARRWRHAPPPAAGT